MSDGLEKMDGKIEIGFINKTFCHFDGKFSGNRDEWSLFIADDGRYIHINLKEVNAITVMEREKKEPAE